MMDNHRQEIIPRTTKYAIEVMDYLKTVKVTIYNSHIIKQLLRSSSSIGANYCEARESTTKNDFRNKVNISKKEAKETIFWLEVLEKDQNTNRKIVAFKQEAYEFVKIFASMISD